MRLELLMYPALASAITPSKLRSMIIWNHYDALHLFPQPGVQTLW